MKQVISLYLLLLDRNMSSRIYSARICYSSNIVALLHFSESSHNLKQTDFKLNLHKLRIARRDMIWFKFEKCNNTEIMISKFHSNHPQWCRQYDRILISCGESSSTAFVFVWNTSWKASQIEFIFKFLLPKSIFARRSILILHSDMKPHTRNKFHPRLIQGTLLNHIYAWKR